MVSFATTAVGRPASILVGHGVGRSCQASGISAAARSLSRPSVRPLNGSRRTPAAARTGASSNKYEGDELYVPPDALGGDSPENKAAKALTTLITYVAVRIIMEQMSGSRHRSPVYNRLRDYINDEEPIKDGAEWLAKLLRHPENDLRLVALRILEVRELYMDTVWDWDELREATEIKLKQDNGNLKKDWIAECMTASGDVTEDCNLDGK